MKPISNLNVVVFTLAVAALLLALAPSARGLLDPVAAEIPPGLTPVAHLPYVVLYVPGRLVPESYLPYVVVGPSPTPTPTPTATPTPPPRPLGLKVYDMYGTQQTYQWAVDKYGVHVEQTGGWAYHCVELREITGPSSLEVWVYRADGLPKPNVRVEFHWPTGMDVRYTEDTGKAGFGYGPGSWIYDATVGGPHWLVIENTSSCDAVSRLGMLAGTVHDHLNVSYRYGSLSTVP
jgi:hypothetical protein